MQLRGTSNFTFTTMHSVSWIGCNVRLVIVGLLKCKTAFGGRYGI